MTDAPRNHDSDHEWFMEQVRREQAGLRAFIRSLGLRAEVVDDVAQEAFVVAFQKLQTFERGTNFGAWLRTIARFLASRELRREERRQRLLGEEVAGLLVESLEPAHPAAAAEAGVRMAALQACLAELPERGRRLLQQRYFDNLTPTLIASLEGRTANDVRQALFRLRAALHACIRRRLEAQP